MTTDQIRERATDVLLERVASSGLGHLMQDVRRAGGEAHLFAGAVRDSFISAIEEKEQRPRDFDVGIQNMNRSQFEKLMMKGHGLANRYGGFRVVPKRGTIADIWRIEETAGVLAAGCSPTIENVLRSFVLDVNAAAFNPTEKVFYDKGALPAICNGKVDLIEDAILHDEEIFAARAILISLRLAFQMSERLQRFAEAHFEPNALKHELRKLPPVWSTLRNTCEFRSTELREASIRNLFEQVDLCSSQIGYRRTIASPKRRLDPLTT